jgi:hypothetical protein
VTWFGTGATLHQVWDEKIIEATKLSFSELAVMIDHPTDTELRAWQARGVLDWAKESMDARPRIYAIGDGKLGYLYAYQNEPLVRRRLLQAGVRLAGILNALFDSPGPSTPDRPPVAPGGTGRTRGAGCGIAPRPYRTPTSIRRRSPVAWSRGSYIASAWAGGRRKLPGATARVRA